MNANDNDALLLASYVSRMPDHLLASELATIAGLDEAAWARTLIPLKRAAIEREQAWRTSQPAVLATRPGAVPSWVQTEPACQECGDRGMVAGEPCACGEWPAPVDDLLAYDEAPY